MMGPLDKKKTIINRAKEENAELSVGINNEPHPQNEVMPNIYKNPDARSPADLKLKDEVAHERVKSNKEKYRNQMGRLARIDDAERKAMSAKAVKTIRAKAASGELSGRDTRRYTRCVNCEARMVCERAFEEAMWRHNCALMAQEEGNPKSINIKKWLAFPLKASKCMYELEDRKSKRSKIVASYNAFLSTNPKDLLTKIREVFVMLEKQTLEDPSYSKLATLYYMLINLYKLKFGDKGTVNVINVRNESSPTLDVKEMMKALRDDNIKEQLNDAIDGDAEEQAIMADKQETDGNNAEELSSKANIVEPVNKGEGA